MSCTSCKERCGVGTNNQPIFNEDKEKRCNRCGKTLDLWDVQENYSLQKHLGYGTKYDGSNLDLQLCCECMDKLIEECVISPVSDNT
jgi:hypothetical protein